MTQDQSQLETLVVDLDQTLLLHTSRTHMFFSISRFFHKLALKNVRLNRQLSESIRNKKVIILTGRNRDWEGEFIANQLAKRNIKYDEMILCPRLRITMDWKRRKLQEIEEKYGSYEWIDDMKDFTESED